MLPSQAALRFYFFLLGWWLVAAVATAQPPPPATPQLWQALRQHPAPDTGRVNRLNRLAQWGRLPAARRDSLLRQALQLAQHLDYAYGQAAALSELAWRAEQSQSARALLHQALPLAERSGDQFLLASILIKLGTQEKAGLPYLRRAIGVARAAHNAQLLVQAYLFEGSLFEENGQDYYRALQAYSQALQAARTGTPLDRILSVGNLAVVYLKIGEYDQALPYFQQTLAQANTLPDSLFAATPKFESLFYIGECYRLTGRYAPAIAAYQQVVQRTAASQRTATYYVNAQAGLADVYERQRRPAALAYCRQVVRATRQSASPTYQVLARTGVCTTLARYFLRVGPADSAVYYGQQALLFAQGGRNVEYVRDAFQLLGQAYAQRRQFGPAYAYQHRYLGLRDTLNGEQVARRVTAVRFAQDVARQKSQIALLTKNQQLQAAVARRQHQLLLAALAVLVLLGGLGFALWRNTRQQQRANALLQQQKAELQGQRDQTTQALDELKTTQAQLIQREKMASLGELTAGIAHEIQNPLNFVNNFAEVSAELLDELAEEQARPTPDAALAAELVTDLRQNLTKITQHGQRAASIVRGMLEHSRLRRGERQPTDLNLLADEYLRLAYQGLRAKDNSFQATLETDFAPALPPVLAVSQDVGRVLLNLFANALYAVRQRQQAAGPAYVPTVRVSTQQVGTQVVVRVHDNGPGIPAAVQAKIFQPFFTTKPSGEGTGLGLSLAHDIVVQGHGGTLTVASEEGVGTEFTLSLPLSAGS